MAKNDRVVLIKGDNSKWYEQAIFIIKKDAPASKIPVDFVLEAENIINSYMSRTGKVNGLASKYAGNSGNAGKSVVKAHKSGADFIPYFAMLVCCVILAYVVFTM